MQDVKELIELGAGLPDGEKFRRIIELASKEVREPGNLSIIVPGTSVRMNVNVRGDCRVVLRVWRKDESEALRIYEELKRAGYEVTMFSNEEAHLVLITHANVRENTRLREPVCRKLDEWFENEKDIKRKGRIAKTMQNLKCLDNT
ncbi:hypothetical protein VMUT_0835 [Vulcanisaeta moutnovskia 768-28]|uniref:Uncharacterized protein n=1 Tax=Vulcanisaeta moutnovskia (strain 768-28) TaxID=985053 RepID=F0QWJ7_VULM7|nr:hypothetical protein [Vulcanisaeta moutnovskia]ADY01045.1 hypothetical protein VMUT_0835 [Vulcanisaeta moutnovskia 768-28]